MQVNGSKNLTYSSNNLYSVYIFTPAGCKTKLALLLTSLTVGLMGLVGNSLILYYVSWKKRVTIIERSVFMKNFNLYIKSLALSDVLCTAVSLPLTCIQFYFDVFQNQWPCIIARYFNIVFPIITIHNLIVISIEKYLSLRRVPRPLNSSTVRKLIFLAWFLGCVTTLFPAATFKGIRYDLNETHFTVICKYDNEHLPFRLMFLSFTLVEYVLPSMFLAAVNISLITTVWVLVKFRVSSQANNPIRRTLRVAKIRGTFLLIAVTFSFIIPYFFYLGYVTYNMIFKPVVDFQTDYVIRYGSGVIAFSNSAINFAIYVVHMKGFRVFLRRLFCGANTVDCQEASSKWMQKASSQQSVEMTILQERSGYGLESDVDRKRKKEQVNRTKVISNLMDTNEPQQSVSIIEVSLLWRSQ